MASGSPSIVCLKKKMTVILYETLIGTEQSVQTILKEVSLLQEKVFGTIERIHCVCCALVHVSKCNVTRFLVAIMVGSFALFQRVNALCIDMRSASIR